MESLMGLMGARDKIILIMLWRTFAYYRHQFFLISIAGQLKENKTFFNLRSPQRKNGYTYYPLYRFLSYYYDYYIPIPPKTGTCKGDIKMSLLTKKDTELLPQTGGELLGQLVRVPNPISHPLLQDQMLQFAQVVSSHRVFINLLKYIYSFMHILVHKKTFPETIPCNQHRCRYHGA